MKISFTTMHGKKHRWRNRQYYAFALFGEWNLIRSYKITRPLLYTTDWSLFVHQALYLVPEFTVYSPVDVKVADVRYVAEVSEPRTFNQPSRVRLVNNDADHVACHNGKQLCHGVRLASECCCHRWRHRLRRHGRWWHRRPSASTCKYNRNS